MTEGTSNYNIWTQWQRAVLDESLATMQRMARMPFLSQRAQRIKKGATPSEVVYEEGRLKLLHYPGTGENKYATPVVFAFALVNRPYILDLKEGKSVVGQFVDRGFDTYLIDWGAPTQADRHLTLDDYINGYMDNVVDFLKERTGADQVSILGYCMGGTMSAIYSALHHEKVRNLILLAAGIDFATRDGLINVWADAETFDVDRFIDLYGNCPGHFLQSSFLLLKPVQNLLQKNIALYERIEDEKFVDDFLAMENWLNDNIDVPGEVFREFVKYLYQQNLLTKGRLPIGKHIVKLQDIDCSVLNLVAEQDDLVPCAQSLPFTDLVGSIDRKTILFKAGHIGLAVGSKAQRELWPQACDWLPSAQFR